MIFETKRLYVTKWKPKDLKALHMLYSDPAHRDFIFPQLTLDETKQIFETQLNHYSESFPYGRYFIVEKLNNKFIGLLLFKKNNNKTCVEIGYSLVKEQWQKGYATEVVRGSINWIFELKGFLLMSAITEFNNENSKNVLLKCGFVHQKNITEDGEEMSLFGIAHDSYCQPDTVN